MKIRNGFVSNSSSSSFMIYGTYLEKDEIAKAVMPFFTAEDFADTGVDHTNEDQVFEYLEEDFNWTIEKKLGNLEIIGGYEDDGRYIGVTWSQIGDDETGAQFKSRVESAVKKIFGDKVKFGTHSEVIYN